MKKSIVTLCVLVFTFSAAPANANGLGDWLVSWFGLHSGTAVDSNNVECGPYIDPDG